tara:strand:+ start:151 stop:528 length:378 start_codon:yes stop_codon:yes gene_type:complete
MEHLIEKIIWLKDKDLMRGYVFGLVHTVIPLIGFYTGWSINKVLKLASSGYLAGILGVVVAHVLADLIAAMLDPHLRAATFGIVLGGLTPLILIPLLEKYVVKSQRHVIVDNSKGLKKDLMEDHE